MTRRVRGPKDQTYTIEPCPECRFELCRSIWMRKCHQCDRLLCMECNPPTQGNVCLRCVIVGVHPTHEELPEYAGT